MLDTVYMAGITLIKPIRIHQYGRRGNSRDCRMLAKGCYKENSIHSKFCHAPKPTYMKQRYAN